MTDIKKCRLFASYSNPCEKNIDLICVFDTGVFVHGLVAGLFEVLKPQQLRSH